MTANVYEELRQHPKLPSPSGVALRILELTASENCDIRELTGLVESDPAIASRLLKLVNSSYMGLSRTVGSVTQAVAMLGIRNVKWIALGFSLVDRNRNGACQRFAYESFWAESLARATAGRVLAWFLRAGDPQEAFACGLLGQIGRLVFAQVYPDRYDNLLASLGSSAPEELCEFEQAVFGLDHNIVAAKLIGEWKLPEPACIAIRHQDNPEVYGAAPESTQGTLNQIQHVGGLVAQLILRDEFPPHVPGRLLRRVRLLGIAPEVFHHLFERIAEEWRDTSAVFSVRTRVVPALAEIYARAQQMRTVLESQGVDCDATDAPAEGQDAAERSG